MFRHILIPTDGSLLSDAALDSGLRLARDCGARVTVVAVTEPFVVLSAEARKIGVSQADHEREVKAAAAGHLTEAARKAGTLSASMAARAKRTSRSSHCYLRRITITGLQALQPRVGLAPFISSPPKRAVYWRH